MTDKNLSELINKLYAAKKDADATKKAYDALKNELFQELDARGVDSYQGADHDVKRTVSTSIRLDNTRIKNEFPEIYQEYGKMSTTTRVYIS